MTSTSTPNTAPNAESNAQSTASSGGKATESGAASAGAETRADKFVRELAELKIPDPAAGKARLWLRIGILLMVVGLVLAGSSYFLAHDTTNPLEQRDAIALGLGGIAATVVGSAVFLRYSLTGFLRFWMARQSFDLNLLADRLYERGIRSDLASDLGSTDTASR